MTRQRSAYSNNCTHPQKWIVTQFFDMLVCLFLYKSTRSESTIIYFDIDLFVFFNVKNLKVRTPVGRFRISAKLFQIRWEPSPLSVTNMLAQDSSFISSLVGRFRISAKLFQIRWEPSPLSVTNMLAQDSSFISFYNGPGNRPNGIVWSQ